MTYKLWTIAEPFPFFKLGVHCASIGDMLGGRELEGEDRNAKGKHNAESFDAEGLTF